MVKSIANPNFDKWASHYDAATPIQNDTVNALSQLIKTHHVNTPQNTWLDLGCGTGNFSQAVLTKLATLDNFTPLTWYGLDNSPNMLAIFEQNLADCQVIDTDFLPQVLLADMQTIPLQDNSINALISSFALHWVGAENIEKMVAELGRVVAHNGQIYVAIPVAGSLSALQARCPNLPIYPFASAEHWLENFDKLIKQKGGTWLFQQNQRFSYSYPNVRSLLTALKSMGGTFSHTQSGTVAAVKQLRHYLQEDRAINLDYQVLLVGIQLKA